MTLILLAIAWMLGIVAADVLHLPLPPLLIGALVGGVVAALAGRAPRLRLAALLLCFAALGGVRWDQFETFPEFMDYLTGKLGINFACYVGHSNLRRWVRGEAFMRPGQRRRRGRGSHRGGVY